MDYSCVATEKVPEPLIIRGDSWYLADMPVNVHVVVHLSAAITLVSLIQFQQFCDFLKAWKKTFQMMC